MGKYHNEGLEGSRISTFIVCEVENIIGRYRYGRAIHAKTLTAAKAIASKGQTHEGILDIEDLDGYLLSYKDSKGNWHDQ